MSFFSGGLGLFGGGGIGGLGDMLFGTEDEAMQNNLKRLMEAKGILEDVDLTTPFDQARNQLLAGRQDIQRNFQQGINAVGAAGTGASLANQAATTQAVGGARMGLQQRGLWGTPLAAQAEAGVRGQGAIENARIQSQTAAGQAGLMAGRGQALAGNRTQIASTFPQQAGMQLNRAQSLAQLLSSVQEQGTPGLVGPLLGAVAGGLGGGLGLLAGNLVSDNQYSDILQGN